MCRFSPRESLIIDDLMYGYSVADIADRLGITRQTVSVMFARAVKKIVEANKANWEQVYAISG